MINLLNEWFTAILILTGTIFTFLSAVGLIRLPDVYSRVHAASKSATLGVLFILLGVFIFFIIEERFFSTKLFLGIFFVFITAPVSAHMICRSAYRAQVKLCESSIQDDLKDYLHP